MASLGQELKRERELRGISLEEISESTKINLKFLQALEEDKLEVMPSKFFIRALLRTYAKFLGLEEHSVLNKYHEAALSQEQAQPTEEQSKTGQEETSKKRKRWMASIILGACLLILIGWFYYFAPKKKISLPPAETKPSITLQEETPLPSPATQPEIPVEPAAEEKGLTLEISFTEETWLQVYADGELKLEALKKPGETAVVQAQQELLFSLGNAGGITYSLNHKKGKPFGTSGAVRRNIVINLENYKNFLAEEKENTNNP
jgi:cytoskeletal protein RodZ